VPDANVASVYPCNLELSIRRGMNTKLNYRRAAARRFVSLNIR